LTAGDVFEDSSTVALSVGTISGSGIGATIAAPSQLTLPADWAQLDPTELSGTLQSSVTIQSGVQGTHTGSIPYWATGVNTVDGDTITRLATIVVSWTTLDCDDPAPKDTTAPIVTLVCPDEPIERGATALASWVASDEDGGSGLAVSSGTIALDTTQYGQGLAVAPAGTAVDKAGNASVEVTCDYFVTEHTPPVVFITCPTGKVLLGSVAVAEWVATDKDGGSGLATASSGTLPLDTSAYGPGTLGRVAKPV
jgi:hypothetical protein